jgi:hypothetical protein
MRATRKQSSRSHGQAEPPSLDLSIERHLSGGDRRGSSESSMAVARGVAREKKTRVSEGKEATGRTDRAAGRARPVGWRRQVGLARHVGQGWQRER